MEAQYANPTYEKNLHALHKDLDNHKVLEIVQFLQTLRDLETLYDLEKIMEQILRISFHNLNIKEQKSIK